MNSTPDSICQKGLGTFIDFVRDIYNLDFDQKPNYEGLKYRLKYIMCKALTPMDDIFDWNNPEQIKAESK